MQRRAVTLDAVPNKARSHDRISELEKELVSIRRKLMSVPEMDRHYAYRMRVSVDEVLDDISNTLRT